MKKPLIKRVIGLVLVFGSPFTIFPILDLLNHTYFGVISNNNFSFKSLIIPTLVAGILLYLDGINQSKNS